MKKLAFIINPVSGRKSKANIPELISRIIDKNKFEVHIFYTERRNHGSELALELQQQGYERLVAVGGDGTVNEVAKMLLHSQAALGIIPLGSGNGLARHLGIPMETEKALKVINQDHCIKMDTGTMNDIPFFCTSGVGFDAYIGSRFAEEKKRGFQKYIKTTLEGFLSYKSTRYLLTSSFGNIDTEAFLITIGNTSQYGNNAFICPFADVQDGMLDVSIIRPFPKVYVFDIGRRLFGRTLESSKYTTLFKTSELTITREKEGFVHVDGEPIELGKDLKLKVIPESLNILVPQK